MLPQSRTLQGRDHAGARQNAEGSYRLHAKTARTFRKGRADGRHFRGERGSKGPRHQTRKGEGEKNGSLCARQT
jgi:hypothetical protein